jgi:hypothetical protein
MEEQESQLQENQIQLSKYNRVSEVSGFGKQDMDKQLSILNNENNAILDQIESLSLVDPSMTKEFVDNKEFLLSTFSDCDSHVPMVIKLSSILSDHRYGTVDSKYFHCKDEVDVHYDQLTKDVYKIKKMHIDMDELEYKIMSLNKLLEDGVEKLDPVLISYDIQRLKIKKEEYVYESKRIERDIRRRIREINDWAHIAKDLAPKVEHKENRETNVSKNFFTFLEHSIENAKNDKEKSEFTNQLNTLKRILMEEAFKTKKDEH